MKSPFRLLIGIYIFFSLALFFYSFTQIDLSLTFSQATVFQTFEKAFQYVGYFNRPLSTELFLIIVFGLFASFVLLVERIRMRKLTKREIWVIGGVVLLLTLSYNAFSYDLFNYIFDAKIFTFYHKNPYLFKALDFPGDPMLSFMRWTHRTYPYGPTWLLFTIPLSYLGLQYFSITFFLFKFLMAACFVGSTYFIYKILKEVSPENAVFGTAFFALNPLVIIESLVSAHNDIVMLFLALAGLFFLIRKQLPWAVLLLLLSIGIKFATAFLIPVYLYVFYCQVKKKTVRWEKVWFICIVLGALAVLAASVRSTFQPWYLFYLLPFAALLAWKKYIFSPIVLISLTAFLNYTPYIFSGNWNPPIPAILFYLNVFSALAAIALSYLLWKQEKRARLPAK